MHINSYLSVNGLYAPTKRLLAEWIQKQDTYMYFPPIRDPPRSRDIYRLKVRG